jgi:hypothetical protein
MFGLGIIELLVLIGVFAMLMGIPITILVAVLIATQKKRRD